MTSELEKQWNSDPRKYALDLVDSGMVNADDMLIMMLKHMSHYNVTIALDDNELSPRFIEPEDEIPFDDIDKSHGSPFDRGMHDSYYHLERNPHCYKGVVPNTRLVDKKFMSNEEITEYKLGYNYNSNMENYQNV